MGGGVLDRVYGKAYKGQSGVDRLNGATRCCLFFQAEDGIRGPLWSRGLGYVYKGQRISCRGHPSSRIWWIFYSSSTLCYLWY